MKNEMKRMVITTRTLANGYELIVDNTGFMYFNTLDLLEGFMVHVGLERLEAMGAKDIKALLEAMKDGSALKKMQAEVTELKATVSEQDKLIREQKKLIKQLKKELNM